MKNLAFQLTVLLTFSSVIARTQTHAKLPSSASKAEQETARIGLGELSRVVEQISPGAAKTMDARRKLKNEPAPVVFDPTKSQVSFFASAERRNMDSSLQQMFIGQLAIGLAKAHTERGDAIKRFISLLVDIERTDRNNGSAYTGAEAAADAKNFESLIADLGDPDHFNNRALVGIHRVERLIRPLVEATAAEDEGKPLQLAPDVAGAGPFNKLLRSAGQMGPDVPITLNILREVETETLLPNESEYHDWVGVLAGLSHMLGGQVLMDVSRAYMDKDLIDGNKDKRATAIATLRALVGDKITIVVGQTQWDESFEDTLRKVGDFSQDDNITHAQALGLKLFTVIQPIVDATVAVSPPAK